MTSSKGQGEGRWSGTRGPPTSRRVDETRDNIDARVTCRSRAVTNDLLTYLPHPSHDATSSEGTLSPLNRPQRSNQCLNDTDPQEIGTKRTCNTPCPRRPPRVEVGVSTWLLLPHPPVSESRRCLSCRLHPHYGGLVVVFREDNNTDVKHQTFDPLVRNGVHQEYRDTFRPKERQ